MKNRILYIKVSGFKCLEKPMEFFFANKTGISPDVFKEPFIKAIYGTNGVGKSSFIQALDVYREFCINPSYVEAKNWRGEFKTIINHKLKTAFVKVVCCSAFQDNDDPIVTSHEIAFTLIDDQLSVEHEKLSLLERQNWFSGKESTLIESDGKSLIRINRLYSKLSGRFQEKSANMLGKVSFLYLLSPLLNQEDLGSNYLSAHFRCVMAGLRLVQHGGDRYIPNSRMINTLNALDPFAFESTPQSFVNDGDEDSVSKKDIKAYEEGLRNAATFLRVFKPSLSEIKISKTEDGDFYRCRKTLIYDDGTPVDFANESTAIKKLMRLYTVIGFAANGGIAFIDEFDSDIHDVYFCALIEYCSIALKGQLCYTTHNVSAMEILKDIPHSLDFLGKEGVTSWKKNGNYSPIKLYQKGMIPNSFFNVTASDFVGVF